MYVLETKEQSVRDTKLLLALQNFAQLSVRFNIDRPCDEKWTKGNILHCTKKYQE